MPTFDTPKPIAATVVVGGAQVRITASDRTDTIMLVEAIDRASKKDLKMAGQTKIAFAAGQLSVKTTISKNESGSVVITIDLPASSSLITYLAHSRVHADNSLNEYELHITSNQVQLDRINALQTNIAASQITVGHIAERATIDNTTFAIRISETKNTIKLSNSNKQTWIGHTSAGLDLSSGSGGFDIDRTNNGVTAATNDDAIRINRLTHNQTKLLNGSENIEINIDKNTTTKINTTNKQKSVHNSIPSQKDPDTPDNTITIRARTQHNDIIIHRTTD